MVKTIRMALPVFILGIGGGIFGAQILWPLLVERPLFYQFRLEQAPTYVTQVNEIKVQENVALLGTLRGVKKAVVGIEIPGTNIRGSGLVLTSDGIVVTLNDLVPRYSESVFVIENESLPYQILKRDPQNNLVLVKLEKDGLSTISFKDTPSETGQRIFLLAKLISRNIDGSAATDLIANEGVIRSIDEQFIETSIFDKSEIKGSPLFDVDGSIVGLVYLDRTGRVFAVPSAIIREFAGF